MENALYLCFKSAKRYNIGNALHAQIIDNGIAPRVISLRVIFGRDSKALTSCNHGVDWISGLTS